MNKKPIPYSQEELYGRGGPREYTGEALGEVAFPLGGIGTGTVSLGGRGQLRDWEIFNRPGKGKELPYTFFALWAQPERGPRSEGAVARVLEARLQPPFGGATGPPTSRVSGLPRLDSARFTGAYPFGRIAFEDEAIPLGVTLEAFNPFIPLDADASGLPVAIFRWLLHNPGPAPVDATVAFSLLNAVGYDGQASLSNRRSRLFGANCNEFIDEDGIRGLRMTGSKYPTDSPQSGSMALLTSWPDVTYSVHWERAGWWDDLQSFWDDFRTDGRLPDNPATDGTPDGETDVGTLGLRLRLGPGESAAPAFVLAWHFPNLVNYWNREEAVQGKRLGNYYSAQFPDAWAAGRHAIEHLESLESRSRLFVETLYESSVPEAVLDAVSSQASIIRTTTCLRTEDGRFHAFEGCHDNAGCCPMDCTHVWAYEWTLACLFPALERSMRLTDFGVNTRPDGRMAFRTLLPLAPEMLWGGPPAADGQMACVAKLYREWQLSGDESFLRGLWPCAKQAIEFAWKKWDPDRDGVMEGEQHNTYDIEFYGPNTMTGTWYLAALKAAGLMAKHLGEDDFAAECHQRLEMGSRLYDEQLWNGEYYIQRVIPPAGPAEGLGLGTQSLQASGEVRYQYGPGCLSDQLLGQWFAGLAGLGPLLPVQHVKSALAAIFRHNFRADLTDHHNCQRTYALGDESGLLLCTWPKGGRPGYPFPYADEVWTGIEYQVAAHLIHEGMVDEGLAIVHGVRARHDGRRRNPWDEFECGHHYARAMASWSLLLALSGFRYSAPETTIGFAPRVSADDFRCFFSTGTAWGLYRQERSSAQQRHRIEVREGELTLAAWTLSLAPAELVPPMTQVTVRSATVEQAELQGDRLTVRFAAPVTLSAGEVLEAHLLPD